MQKRLLTFGFSCLSLGLLAQSVGINTDGSAPTAGYLLDVKGQTIIQNNLHVSGNVGIGTTTPSVALDVNGTAALNDNALRLRGGGDGNHYLSYLGGSFDGPKLNGNATVVISTNGTLGGDDLVLKNNRIGINTDNPSYGLLHVNGYYDHDLGGFAFYAYNGNWTAGGAGGNADISIYASNRVSGSEFHARSDARIKNIIGVSNSKKDLNDLLKIEITDYSMIDKTQQGRKFKKLIAQQVEKIYPDAVSYTTDIIPDIYKVASAKDNFIALETDLKVGDKVKLFLPNEELITTVTSVKKEGFSVENKVDGEVFVYGREVSDSRTVDYDAISMLNVSATQELYKIIQAQKEEIESLKKENGVLKASVESNKADLDLIKTTLNLVGQK